MEHMYYKHINASRKKGYLDLIGIYVAYLLYRETKIKLQDLTHILFVQ